MTVGGWARCPGVWVGALALAGWPVAGLAASSAVPAFDHIVVVVMENHRLSQVIGSPEAPYLNSLARSGANLLNAHGVTHPSQANYLVLFSGDTHGVRDDRCPLSLDGPNLASQLHAAGKTFVGYAEDLPAQDPATCYRGAYARKHNPWVNFGNVPATVNQPFTAFPADYTRLPHLAFVIPNQDNDMHNGSVALGDRWLREHLQGYAHWARMHNSLLIVTFDEDDSSTPDNLIPTVFYGAHVKTGEVHERVDHYRLLATLQASLKLPRLTSQPPVTAVFRSAVGR